MLGPFPMIGVVAAVLLAVNLAAAFTLSQSPHPVLDFSVKDDQVIGINRDGEALNVRALTSDNDSIVLTPLDLLEEPDVVSSRQEYERFMDRQGRIHDILTSGSAHITTGQGEFAVEMEPTQATPTEFIFWVQLVVGNIGVLIGIAVWTLQRENEAARHLLVSGIGLAISSIAAGIYSSRPLALDDEVFRVLGTLNMLGVFVFCAGFLGMMWSFPRRLSNRPYTRVWYSSLALFFGVASLGVIPSMDISQRLTPMLTLVLAGCFLWQQWRNSRGDALTRQSLRWFIFVTLSGTSLFALMVIVPAILGLPVYVSQGAAFFAFLTIYVGIAVGVARYPMFDLQEYWVKSVPWVLSGLVVIGLNLLLVTWFGFSLTTAGIMAVGTFAALVVPARFLGDKISFNRAASNFQQHLPLVITNISAAAETQDLNRVWSDQLAEIFRPLSIQRESIAAVKPVVVRSGLGMVVPGLDGKESFLMEHADQGIRLFTSLDVKLMESLKELYIMSQNARAAREEGTRNERARLRKDIHDSLGGRLLTIMHSTNEPVVASESRQAMNELRDILAAVEGSETLLTQVLDRWRAQISQQSDVFNVKLDWQVDSEIEYGELSLPGQTRLNVGRILTEAVTNAIRHAEATHISVDFRYLQGQLELVIVNDGSFKDPAEWQSGFGLNNIRERADELNGEVKWQMMESRQMRFELSIPLHEPTARLSDA